MEKVGGEEDGANTKDKPVASNTKNTENADNSVALPGTPPADPTANPTANPTENPTANPTENPTENPPANPTADPSENPPANPTAKPPENPPVKSADEPPVDWFEPLEEDDDEGDDGQSYDQEMESLAGDNERSGSEKSSWRRGGGAGGNVLGARRGRRKNCAADEGWEECPALGEGWRRREVLRRSGISVGQKDVYYLSPEGDRLRSRIELLKHFGNTMDLTKFDYKSGQFGEFEPVRKTIKRKKKRRSSPIDGSYSSESSFQDNADPHDRTYSPGPTFPLRPFAPQSAKQSWISPEGEKNTNVFSQALLKPPSQTFRISSKIILGICKRCRNSFTVVQGQTMCEKCNQACNASKDTRKIAYRKWLPCGFCQACQLTEDCGECGRCVTSKGPVRCHKRKCLNPSEKKPDPYYAGQSVKKPEPYYSAPSVNTVLKKPDPFFSAPFVNTVSKKPDSYFSAPSVNTVLKPQIPVVKEAQQLSDSDEQSPLNNEDDDRDNEDLVRTFRRSCGTCKGCMSKEDCGICDYCRDNPKFGGSNKKRQKCRQRQCQSEPMTFIPRIRARPKYCYGSKNKEKVGFNVSDDEHDPEKRLKSLGPGVRHLESGKDNGMNYNGQERDLSQAGTEDLFVRHGKWPRMEYGRTSEGEDTDDDLMEPTITQIFSLGDEHPGDTNLDLELLELLDSLRDTLLPVLWCVVLAEGPCLQLLQCSKLSAMADTVVQIEPSFRYHVSVQGQPLLPTHPLYHDHPTHLTTVAQVSALLADLERYSVCRGFKRDVPVVPEPIVQVRAATCDFLVAPGDPCCARCKNPEQEQ